MTKLINDFSYYFLSPIILLISLGISGCIFNNPAHSPPITGDIEISKDSKGGLCFMPLLDSATFMEEPVNLRSMNMEYLTISDPNSTGGNRIKINIEPKSKKYFTLKNGQKICLNTNNPKLEKIIYTSLDKRLLSVSIAGLDDKKEISIIFYKEFDHPYLLEQ